MSRTLVALLIGAAVVAACRLEAGLGLPQQQPNETYPGDRVQLTGVLVAAANGCLHVDLDAGRRFVIWPRGSELADVGQGPAGVQLPDGQVIAPGDGIAGVGALTPTAALIEERNGYWAYAIGYCAREAGEVVVFDSVGRLD